MMLTEASIERYMNRQSDPRAEKRGMALMEVGLSCVFVLIVGVVPCAIFLPWWGLVLACIAVSGTVAAVKWRDIFPDRRNAKSDWEYVPFEMQEEILLAQEQYRLAQFDYELSSHILKNPTSELMTELEPGITVRRVEDTIRRGVRDDMRYARARSWYAPADDGQEIEIKLDESGNIVTRRKQAVRSELVPRKYVDALVPHFDRSHGMGAR